MFDSLQVFQNSISIAIYIERDVGQRKVNPLSQVTQELKSKSLTTGLQSLRAYKLLEDKKPCLSMH